MAVQKPRVLVVQDDRAIRSSLDVALRTEGYEVRTEGDSTTIDRVAETFRPDLAILDVKLSPGPDGLAAARRLRAGSDLAILFLSTADSVADRLAGFEAGGDDYMVKPFSMAELLARARVLLKRAGRLSSAVRQVGDLVIDDGARTVARGDNVLDLTRTEYEILLALARRPGRVLTKVQLLVEVWGFDTYDVNLVEVHLSALRRKLEAHGPRSVHTVRGVGYVLRA